MRIPLSFCLHLVLVCYSYQARSQFVTNIIVEEVDLSPLGIIEDSGPGGITKDFTGYTNYKVYAELGDPTYRIASIAGINFFNSESTNTDEQHDLIIGAEGGTFYNHPQGGLLGSDQLDPESFFGGFYPSATYDTFLTIGIAHSDSPGANTLGSIASSPSGAVLTDWGEIDGSGELNAQDAVIFTTPDESNSLPDENGRIFLGQFTTDGSLYFEINITGQSGGPGFPSESWAINNIDNYADDLNPGNNTIHECGCSAGLIYPLPTDCASFSLGCPGCLDELACNYNPNFIVNDDTLCLYGEIGCTDPQATNYNALAGCNDGSCTYSLLGCTDTIACNYEPNATEDNGSCTFPGCTDETACNFDSQAGCDNGDCLYQSSLSGYVYRDLDMNGSYDQGESDEYGLTNVEIKIVDLNRSVFTNSDGYYEFLAIAPNESYTIVIDDLNAAWQETIPLSQPIEIFPCDEVLINWGLSDSNSQPLFSAGSASVFMEDIHCEHGYNPGIWLHNEGSTALNGTITLDFDPSLSSEEFGYLAEPASSTSPGSISWEIEDQPGGTRFNYQTHILGPGSALEGEVFPTTITLELEDSGGSVYYTNAWSSQPTVACDYEGQSLYSANSGYTEEHFILEDEIIEYRVRFQNTEGMELQEALVTDLLDLDFIDLDTFYPMAASHLMMTAVNEEGLAQFVFKDLELPDNMTSERGSQGYILFRVGLRADVDPQDVVTNMGLVYLGDTLEGTETNTTWHTVYECPDIPAVAENAIFSCFDDPFQLEATEPYMQSHSWLYNEDEVGTGATLDYVLENGSGNMHEFEVIMSNPLCTTSRLISVSIDNFPQAAFYILNNVMYAEDDPNTEEAGWQWLLNGEPIAGAVDNSYTPLVSGIYQVVVLSENGCPTTSNSLDFDLGMGEVHSASSFILFPNPTSDFLSVDWADNKPHRVQIFSAEGSLVTDIQSLRKSESISVKNLQPGSYYAVIDNFFHLPFIKI